MTFDEQIKKTLEEKSQWSGSSDQLWEKVATQLDQKKPLWHRPPFWLGTAVAAMFIVAVLLQTVFSPLPPETHEAEELPRMQTFSTIMLSPEPLFIQVGAELELALDIYLAGEGETEYAHLLIWKLEELEETLITELDLNAKELLEQGSLTVSAPGEPGSYRLVVQGVARDQEQLYSIYAEQSIFVEIDQN